jgi:hypothetical protein
MAVGAVPGLGLFCDLPMRKIVLFNTPRTWLANVTTGRIWLLEQLGLYVHYQEGLDGHLRVGV